MPNILISYSFTVFIFGTDLVLGNVAQQLIVLLDRAQSMSSARPRVHRTVWHIRCVLCRWWASRAMQTVPKLAVVSVAEPHEDQCPSCIAVCSRSVLI